MHRTSTTFPAPPLKFRTSGFPQYGFKLEFNATFTRRCRLKRRTRIHRCPRAYTKPKLCHTLVVQQQAGRLAITKRTIQSRGPWLPSGLCCPARSLPSMASSETLAPSRRLIFFVQVGPCPTVLYGLVRRGSPICSAFLFHRAIFRTPAVVGDGCFFTDSFGLHPICSGSATATPCTPVLTWEA